jgi:hypothetical protein
MIILGRRIKVLADGNQQAGSYEVSFNASNLASGVSSKGGYASGVYIYQLRAGKFVSTRKMLLVK